MPINGKAPTERKANIARMSYNLQESNRMSNRARPSKAHSYNGLANKEIEQSSYLDLRKKIDSGGRISTFTKLTRTEELDKANGYRDVWEKYGK